MQMLDFSRCRKVVLSDGSLSGVKDHVKAGVEALITHPFFALFDEMGAMKSAQVIIAAQFLFEMGIIDRVIVVAPASVRTGVWFDKELGELARHLWLDMPSTVSEYHAKIRQWHHGPETTARLKWIITNYEFIRSPERIAYLLRYCGPKTLIVLDESSAVKSAKAQQTVACEKLRKHCGRIVLLNGTPIANSPGDMFSQGNLMSKTILNCPSFTQFTSRYAIMKPVLGRGGQALTSPRGFAIKTVDTWSGVEEISRRFAPFVLRRLKKDVMPWLPAKNPPIMRTVALTPATWKHYRSMRDQLVVWLTECSVSQAPQAIVKVMRLAQITSGFLGGVEDMDLQDHEQVFDQLPEYVMQMPLFGGERPPAPPPLQEIGSEKLDEFMSWHSDLLEADPNAKVLVRSRFRAEILRLEKRLPREVNGCDLQVGTIIGGQQRQERQAALRLLDPRTMPKGPAVVAMSAGAGSLGLNLTGSHMLYTLSNDFSLHHRLQGDDRIHRPGQTVECSYFDLVATGPQGQKTIDHHVLAALTTKLNLATLTTKGWLDVLQEE